MEEEIPDKTKKNILDLNYNKHLQYQTNAIIISFTYAVGLSIAWVTNQIKIDNFFQMSSVAVLSIIVLTPCIFTFINSKKHLQIISEMIKKLKIT